MKRINKFLAIALLCFIGINGFGQTTLTPGDIILVTLNADGNKNFDFVPLVSLASGTVIKFTDDAWITSSVDWRGGEGILTYTAPTAISEGTVISFPDINNVVTPWSESGEFNPSGEGDNIIVYQGDETSPSFIYGAGWARGSSVWTYSSTTAPTERSDIPGGLSIGANTIINPGTTDNYQYDKTKGVSGSKSVILGLLANSSNWKSDDLNSYAPLVATFDNTDYTLPIQLISFNANKNNQNIELFWSTASEINNEFFTIERSNDAENFEIVKTVEGAGNSNEIINYSEIDESPLNGISYYRLKQTDFNGDFTYSEIVAVENTTDNLSLKIQNIYSNSNSINFIISNPNLENLSYELINILGEVLFSSKVDCVIEKSKIVVNTEGLSHGIYFIKISGEKETIVEKVLI
ncbi:MAG: T9SS type A sorting domain-containing protein [Saprospiraceae bacterium]|nr:T9SS type A sorting domain-containing protein [Saprospiraceae bacterium]